MGDLMELAARVEALAGPDRETFCAAFRAVFPEVSSGALDAIDAWDAKYDRFCAMLDVGAYLDAAVLLVPKPGKWSITAGCLGDWQACVWLVAGLELDWRSAATPAQALAAAALRALASGGDHGR